MLRLGNIPYLKGLLDVLNNDKRLFRLGFATEYRFLETKHPIFVNINVLELQ